MNYINRDIENLIKNLTNEYSCLLITGPRQVGKTTLLKQQDKKRTIVSLDNIRNRELAKKEPEHFFEIYKPPILIDEVQYAPELFSYIKIAIDEGAPASSFWLTGSQSYNLMSLAKESLAGRVAILHLGGLSQNEIYNNFELTPFRLDIDYLKTKNKENKIVDLNEIYKRIYLGSLPGLVSSKYTNRNIFYE